MTVPSEANKDFPKICGLWDLFQESGSSYSKWGGKKSPSKGNPHTLLISDD